jgi:WD40 repeat protein
VVYGSFDGTLLVWELDHHNIAMLRGFVGGVEKCSFSPDGRMIAAGDSTGRVLFLSVEN